MSSDHSVNHQHYEDYLLSQHFHCPLVCRYIIEEEKELSRSTPSRNFVIERDPSAPEKPSRNPPAMTRVPSDPAVKRNSAHSEFDERVSCSDEL